MANSGPPPARLCALSELGKGLVGEKVRFLGCITHYNTTTALLTLHHSSPTSSHHAAQIDLSLLLSSPQAPPQTNIGEWVNVIGYITSQSSSPTAATTPNPRRVAAGGGTGVGKGGREVGGGDGKRGGETTTTTIQALLVWPTGALNIQDYEHVLSDLQAERKKSID